MNVVLVVFDTLRKDCLGAYGPGPWWPVQTPVFDGFASESVLFTRAYPEALPTLPARRGLYTGQKVWPFADGDVRLKGDFVGAPGWGPIRNEQHTVAEMLQAQGFRTGLISDLYHQFKPSKNFWRGFDQWTFLRGQEKDPAVSGPEPTAEEIERLLPLATPDRDRYVDFIRQVVLNTRDRVREEDHFAPRVVQEACRWLEQNRDADRFFLTVESFDPHEPWIVPEEYRRMYVDADGPEWVLSGYRSTANVDPAMITRARANYSGCVTMCDRWFGRLLSTLESTGRLDETLVVLMSDHGHSIGDGAYIGKRGYPSRPEVCDTPLMVRYPGAQHAGTTCDELVDHTDITATILDAAGVAPTDPIDGSSFLEWAPAGDRGPREHVTVGWGSTPTVVTKRWWLNAKVNETGFFLHDLDTQEPFARNVAAENQDVAHDLFDLARADAGGSFPDWLVRLASSQADAPGCTDLAARA